MSILITGAAGFIGSNFTHFLVNRGYKNIFCIDKLGYASNILNIKGLPIEFNKIDLTNYKVLNKYINKVKPKFIFHFAAESHVDNSINDVLPFLDNNIKATVNLLNSVKNIKFSKLIFISTDEVFGSITKGKFNKNSQYNPLNPYSASKAASEHFINSYANTFKIPCIITNCSNNYGPRQHKEKLIPKIIHNCLNDIKIPIYGNGLQIRDWIYVEDHCDILLKIMKKGKINSRYLIGGGFEITNIELTKKIIKKLKKSEALINFVKDRKGHDFRYAINNYDLKKEFSWQPKTKFNDGIKKTIDWYECN